MMNLVMVGIGGAAGSLARFYLGKFINEKHSKNYPVGTFIINVTGALLLGIVVTAVKGQTYQLLLADGFLGAYTTFSTFMYESFNLTQESEKVIAIKYITSSVINGIIGYGLGVWIGRMFV